MIFFAYIGFDAVSTSAQEARNPQRDMPRGILGSLAICTVLYVLVSGVMVGPRAVQGHAQPAGAARRRDRSRRRPRRRHAVGRRRWRSMKILVTVGALAGLSSVMVVMMLAQPRIFLAMSKDGLMPRWAGKVHPRFHTPHISTIVTGVVVALAAGLTPIGTLGNLVSIGTLMAFVIVSHRRSSCCVARGRTCRVRSACRWCRSCRCCRRSSASLLMLGLPWATWERLIIWMAIGIAFYFVYGYRHSVLRDSAAQ